MPRKCTVCVDVRRSEVDTMLLSHNSVRDTAGRFGLSKSALDRHRQHIAAELANTAKPGVAVVRHVKRVQQRLETLAETWERIGNELNALIKQAKGDGDRRTLLQALAQLQGQVSLAMKGAELLQRNKSAAPLHSHKDFHVLLRVLDRYPECGAALLHELNALDEGAS